MKLSKAEMSARLSELECRIDPLELALGDLVRDRVKWFGRGEFRLGISRPTGAQGGIAIVANGCTSAHYWEAWSRETLQHIANVVDGTNTEHNRELFKRRETIEQAAAYVRAEQSTI